MAFGQPLPDALKDPPELLPGLELYLQAFYQLSTCRQVGMGLGPIGWQFTQEWGMLNLSSEDSIKDLHYFIRILDSEFIKWSSKTNKE